MQTEEADVGLSENVGDVVILVAGDAHEPDVEGRSCREKEGAEGLATRDEELEVSVAGADQEDRGDEGEGCESCQKEGGESRNEGGHHVKSSSILSSPQRLPGGVWSYLRVTGAPLVAYK